ncbi:neuroglobin-like protein [Leptotrombidium deliense]|uniref:Neuroglobin-like protein n=1 Tax=Leptotrombidium deliense TaxID=299467 RepID=A0A443SBK9_9ACAR|nr:neuroglobin-like protein [Leptotrombidium deliense]
MVFKEDGSYDWDMSQLERHAVLVMQALEAAIENLDDSKVLSVILKELGCKHARYNVSFTSSQFCSSKQTMFNFFIEMFIERFRDIIR